MLCLTVLRSNHYGRCSSRGLLVHFNGVDINAFHLEVFIILLSVVILPNL